MLKILCCFFVLSVYIGDITAQTARIPVGTDIFITKAGGKLSIVQNCNRNGSPDSCQYRRDVPAIEYGYHDRELPIEGYPSILRPFYIKSDSIFYAPLDILYLSPNDSIGRNDTIYIYYWITEISAQCLHCDQPYLVKHDVHLHSYFDSSVRINSYQHGYRYVFLYDTNTKGFSLTQGSVNVFNNRVDSVYVEYVKLEIDSVSLINTVLQYDPVLIPPLSSTMSSMSSSNRVALQFTTTRTPRNQVDSFQGTLTLRLFSKGLDSLVTLPVTFVFSAIPAQGGVATSLNEKTFLVRPNPTAEKAIISFSNSERSEYHISIFDELGKEVQTIHNGFLDAGEHEFSAKLPAGMYYVRMQAGDEVVTRKVVVVK